MDSLSVNNLRSIEQEDVINKKLYEGILEIVKLQKIILN